MKKEHDIFGNTGLQFFGKISASLSHELKNALAVINENAGLLTDLVHMSEKGHPLDPGRIKGVGSKVMEKVKHADSIIKNMNAFAHSVDIPVSETDIGETLTLLLALTRRITSNRGIRVYLDSPASPLCVHTSAYGLLHLCWDCIESFMDWVGEEKEIGLVPEKTEQGCRIRFCKLEQMPSDSEILKEQKELLKTLRAELAAETDKKEVILMLPLRLS
ncbi:MAG: hypothetical protein V2I97_18215 [Desulfococcaceae bacterium]|jgi:light-regulated signal transduction histidine kinase (bacteriophytochrome)|nr:hypothetical protein [Desulfococcaceae bacterium]